MVRSVYYGPHLTEKLSELCNKGTTTGLVLGSALEDRLFSVCLVETPAETEPGDGPESELVKKDAAIDVTWMLEHARQVYRLLPGQFLVHEGFLYFILFLCRWPNNIGGVYISQRRRFCQTRWKTKKVVDRNLKPQ